MGRACSGNPPQKNYLLDIDADGSWTVDVHQPRYSSVEVASLAQSMEKSNSDYLGPFQAEGLTRVSFEGKTDDHYGVWLMNHHGEKVELLFNEIGPFTADTASNADGVALIQVETNGGWRMDVKEG